MTKNETTTILVCDDEVDLCEMLEEYLGKRGFKVLAVHDTAAMRNLIAVQDVDLILLDVNMPGEDGLSALRTLRVEDRTPVVMLTAAGETIDRIVGLEMGADDYLGKPVDLRELEARIKAVLRRAPVQSPELAMNGETDALPFGPYTLDLGAAKLLQEDGQEVPLTAMEFRLIKLFAENRSRVLNRDQILEQAHDRSWDPFDRSIDIRISRLRRKIETNPQKPRLIRTVRGLGYVFDPD
ncbi:response regulator [Meridianimarinicoccus sp. MJW13]|uniref:response regulator n=1 Tax=Meridianimarinicoccus sp. MJW13 TaxID=2720031 RepID=UPI001867D5C1|nr:response regulator [Fluviibacterium sp. MJW13]